MTQEQIFIDEIGQIPVSLGNLIDFYRQNDGAELLKRWAQVRGEKKRMHVSGMGTSLFAPLAIRPLCARYGVELTTLDTGEWLHYGCPVHPDCIVVLVSQSGETVEIVRALEKGLAGRYIACTNDTDSTLARHANLVFPLCAGHESSISTKTYTNTLALLFLLACTWGDRSQSPTALDRLEAVRDCMEQSGQANVDRAAAALMPVDTVSFVGRGPSLASACQCALTFMEGTRCQAAAFTGGAFRHGPFEALGSEFRMVAFAPGGQSYSLMNTLVEEASGLGAHVVVFTDRTFTNRTNCHVVKTTSVEGEFHEDLFPLAISHIHPMLLYRCALNRGITPGQFRYGDKITRRE
jgi:glucosamine--fructose-6-phosphate aminotransferase (isomerizing)